MKKDILLIFKTHLDIGFTNYSKNVVESYMKKYIPNAIQVGYELKGSDTPFVWTVGSWLIWEALKNDDGTLEQAIKDGIITWHALPFTTHTETMSVKLFEYGLSLSQKLDERFGKKTIAAKMTDVPGHTQAMVTLMANKGIEFMHIGVNEVAPLPNVPPIFNWKCDDSFITVMYCTSYGDTVDFGSFAVMFAHTLDNKGPQSAEEIRKLYSKIKEQYPDANIKATTLNDVALRLREIKDIPVFDKEIGDTWIFATGSDPKKVGMYRELLRHYENVDYDCVDLTDNLLLVPEHTWGMDTKIYFNHPRDFYNDEFAAYANHPDKIAIERSWQEQRDYVLNAQKVLGFTADYILHEPDVSQMSKISSTELDIELSWQIFDSSDYKRFIKNYMQLDTENIIWGAYDYVKVGLPKYEGGIYSATVTEAYESNDNRWYKLEFPKEIVDKYGVPYYWVNVNGENLEIRWFDKVASRIPQAAWLKVKGFDNKCEVRKLGRWIKPCNMVGSPLICATDYGVRSKNGEIISLDSMLVAPYGRRLLDFETNPTGEDLYFNLYNNVFNTNFPMWYGDDTRFRFIIKNKTKRSKRR